MLWDPWRFRYDSIDQHGFGEFFGAAWFSREGRARRARSPHAQGPWGLFVRLSHTPEGWATHARFEALLTTSVGAGLMALDTGVSLTFFPCVALSIWAGRAAFTLLPLLEGVGPEEGIWGLEPASWAELSGDLRAWLMGEAEAMEARGQTTCTSCSRLSEAEARDSTAPRDLDVAVASRALRASQTPTSPTGAPDPLTLHPEAPSLERREALNALA